MGLLNFLLILHLAGLVMGFVGGRSHAEIVARMRGASVETAALLWNFERKASYTAFVGTALLIVSGITLLLVKYGSPTLQPWLFWLKMALVVVVTVAEIVRHVTALKWKDGDEKMEQWTKVSGKISGFAAMAVVVVAVIHFNY